MQKFFLLLVCIYLLHGPVISQGVARLSGMVVDESNEPLTGAYVYIFPLHQATVTDAGGKFLFDQLSDGVYRIEISFIGFKTLSESLLISGSADYHAMLITAPMSLQEVVVKDNYAETRKKESPLNIEIVNEDYLKKHQGGSLMKSLERLPGVSTIDIGSGQSKPVIRGLGFNRVLVVENGVKHEGQQWGADHGLEIDQYAIDDVEVLKGPASFLYGSGAIGGVIDIRHTKIPENNSLGGVIDLSGKSNNGLLGGSFALSGRKNRFFAGMRATILDYADYKVPADSVDIYSYRAPLYNNNLRNTAGRELNLHTNFGLILPNLQSRFYVSHIWTKGGFFANTHGLEPRNVDTDIHDQSNRDILDPFQEVKHLKVINKNMWLWNTLQIETNLGFQRNFRQEWSDYVDHGFMPPVFPDSLSFPSELEREFEKYIYSGNFRVSWPIKEEMSLVFGTNIEYQDNGIDGRGFIIPAFKQVTAGGFTVMKLSFKEKSIFQVGIRYDFGRINSFSYSDWFPSPVIEGGDTTWQYLQRTDDLYRSFSSLSMSVGYNYNPDNWSLRINIGKGFRMPIAKELAANGVNYHHFSYEVGNPDLSPEISWQIDAGAEYRLKKFAIEATPFLNYFSNYIYLNPTPEYDRLYGNGNQIYQYTQSEVVRYGAEIHAHYQLFKPLQLGVIGEYVYSEQRSGDKKGYTLPFSPPASAIFNVKFQKQKIHFIKMAYFSVDYRVAVPQNNIVPPEETTAGYQVVHVGLGGVVKLQNQKVVVSVQVQNLLNGKYFNHTSYYRLINVPEPGRNFIINISFPFIGKINKKTY